MRALLPLLALCFTQQAWAQQLEIRFFEVGQGDATLVIGPDGTTFLLDGGPNGQGNSTLVPYLQSRGITELDYVAASHYHADHVGGLDEIWQAGIQTSVCLDRGDSNTPTTQTFNDYRNTYSAVRQTALPGQVVALGDGATATCLVVEGALLGGGSVNISSSAQYENSASIAWLIEYGDFDLYVAGDLTGGGNGATDVESAVGAIAGDLDIVRVSHHGSRTSTQSNFVALVQPEAAIISCGSGNQYGFPKQDTVDRLNRWDRVIPVWCTTDGTGGTGYVDAGGDITLTTDGVTWSLSGEGGVNLTAHCDGLAPSALTPGSLVVSEIMRNPTRVNDDDGEWFELAGARVGEAVSLQGVTVQDGGVDQFDLAASIQLAAGDVCTIAASGLPALNGGLRPQIAWPVGTMQLSNAADELQLSTSTTIDQVSWSSSWPGAVGASAEREDLLSAGVEANFVEGVTAYGLGDLGSPGRTNDGDTTSFGSQPPYIVVNTPPTVGGMLEMDWFMPGEAGRVYQGWITFATTPGITVGGTHIPANMDAAYRATYKLPGWSGYVPVAETVAATTNVPNNSQLSGMIVYAILVTLDLPDQIRSQSTPVAMIIL